MRSARTRIGARKYEIVAGAYGAVIPFGGRVVSLRTKSHYIYSLFDSQVVLTLVLSDRLKP